VVYLIEDASPKSKAGFDSQSLHIERFVVSAQSEKWSYQCSIHYENNPVKMGASDHYDAPEEYKTGR